MFNDRFQVVGVMDIGTTTGTKGDATPVEDLYRLLSTTRRLRMATNTGNQYSLNLQNEMPTNVYNPPPVYMPPTGYGDASYRNPNLSSVPAYYAQNRSESFAPATQTQTTASRVTWADLARMLDRR